MCCCFCLLRFCRPPRLQWLLVRIAYWTFYGYTSSTVPVIRWSNIFLGGSCSAFSWWFAYPRLIVLRIKKPSSSSSFSYSSSSSSFSYSHSPVPQRIVSSPSVFSELLICYSYMSAYVSSAIALRGHLPRDMSGSMPVRITFARLSISAMYTIYATMKHSGFSKI